MPRSIRVRNQDVNLSYPDENGVSADFFTCFLSDEYGLAQISSNVGIVVDIGANVGFFSLAARSYFPDAKIHAFEPNPRALRYLLENVKNVVVEVYAEAVGASDGWVSIRDSGDSNLAQTVVAAQGAPGAVRQVSLSSIVERCGGCVDVAKIDCEGAEWDLFLDATPWQKIGQLRMEYHLSGNRKFEDVVTALQRLNFEIFRHNSSGAWGTIWARNRALRMRGG